MFLFLLYFWSYKFSLGEQNRPLKKKETLKNLSDYRLLNGSINKFWTVITLVWKLSFQLRQIRKKIVKFIFFCYKTFKILIMPKGITLMTPYYENWIHYRLNGGWSVISTCRYLYNNSYLSNILHISMNLWKIYLLQDVGPFSIIDIKPDVLYLNIREHKLNENFFGLLLLNGKD